MTDIQGNPLSTLSTNETYLAIFPESSTYSEEHWCGRCLRSYERSPFLPGYSELFGSRKRRRTEPWQIFRVFEHSQQEPFHTHLLHTIAELNVADKRMKSCISMQLQGWGGEGGGGRFSWCITDCSSTTETNSGWHDGVDFVEIHFQCSRVNRTSRVLIWRTRSNVQSATELMHSSIIADLSQGHVFLKTVSWSCYMQNIPRPTLVNPEWMQCHIRQTTMAVLKRREQKRGSSGAKEGHSIDVCIAYGLTIPKNWHKIRCLPY